MVVKIIAVGGLYVLMASLLLVYSIPAARLALGNLLFGEEVNETKSPVDTFILFSDSFDSQDHHWYWFWRLNGTERERSLSIRDGSLFLNLSEEVDDWRLVKVWLDDGNEGRGKRWLYVGVEIRLRCSDDNGLESDEGRGIMFWGLVDISPGFPDNTLGFRSHSPESDPDLAGFQVYSKVDGLAEFAYLVTGIDLREWHRYTILWRPGNASFLIDDVVVASTDVVPSTPMEIAFHMENSRWGSEGVFYAGQDLYLSYLDLLEDQSIEVDHVRVFMGREDYEEYSTRLSELIVNVSSLIEAADDEGLNTTVMRRDLASLVEDWDNLGYVHGERHMRLLAMMELEGQVEDIGGLFREASEIIASARKMGYEDLRVLEAFYGKAEEAWDDYDYDRARNMLETVMEWKW